MWPSTSIFHRRIPSHVLPLAAADAPYELSPEFLHELFTKHRIDYVVHGDDPCLLPDGTDAYAYAKKLHRFKMIKRTEGVSSTDIVGRMLMCTRDNARFREVRDLAFTDNEQLGDAWASIKCLREEVVQLQDTSAHRCHHQHRHCWKDADAPRC